MKKVLTIIFILLLCGCTNKTTELENILKDNNYIIIDVRTPEEYNKSHLKEAINIPYDQLNDNIDKDKTILVYCQSGRRSQIAYELLTNFGFTVYDLGAYTEINLPKE